MQKQKRLNLTPGQEKDQQEVLKKLDGRGPLHGASTKMSNNNTSDIISEIKATDIKALLERNGLKVRFRNYYKG